MPKQKPTSTSPTVNTGQGALPAGSDRMGRRVPSEPPYSYVDTSGRDVREPLISPRVTR